MENGETGPDVGLFLSIICVLSYQFAVYRSLNIWHLVLFPFPLRQWVQHSLVGIINKLKDTLVGYILVEVDGYPMLVVHVDSRALQLRIQPVSRQRHLGQTSGRRSRRPQYSQSRTTCHRWRIPAGCGRNHNFFLTASFFWYEILLITNSFHEEKYFFSWRKIFFSRK